MIYFLAALLAAAAVVLDRIVKHYVIVHIPLNTSTGFIPGLMDLTHIHNVGASFSMLSGARWLLVGVAVVFMAAVVVLLAKRIVTRPFGVMMLACVFGGALGNAIDRALWGYVVDMFQTTFVRFAIFNVADIFVVCGGILFCIWFAFFSDKKEKQP